jgi:linoleoyl-CoA desaturase
MSAVKFNNTGSPFFKSLKTKVNLYFSENQLPRTGGSKLFFKSILFATSAIAIYIVLVFFTPPPLIAIVLCCLFGSNLAGVGFNIMHEAGHWKLFQIQMDQFGQRLFAECFGRHYSFLETKTQH